MLAKLKYLLPVAAIALSSVLGSCSMMNVDREDCPLGAYITFKYDYNLQRADMRPYHVGAITLYVYDEDGNFVTSKEESNSAGHHIDAWDYKMRLVPGQDGLPAGDDRYQLIALAAQTDYATQLSTNRAKFVRKEPAKGSKITDLEVLLDRTKRTDAEAYDIVHNSLPLDTLWHGMKLGPVDVYADRPTYDTISLVRDTKKINVTLRELDDPTTIDIADYDCRIIDRNSHILWDNSLNEADTVVYTPHFSWITEDKYDDEDEDSRADGDEIAATAKIAHYDFMTSRILDHDKAADDGALQIFHRSTGAEVTTVNLPDMLSRLRRYEELYAYTPQEFLDRGYDYQLDFFLKGDKLQYVNISISVLSWSLRIQFENLD